MFGPDHSQRGRYLKILGAFFVAALLFRSFLFEIVIAANDTMSPTIQVKDWVVVWKSAFGIRMPLSSYEVTNFRRPNRGELVVYSLPDQGFATSLNRVVAVEGDKVEIKDNALFVNDMFQRVLLPQPTLLTLQPVDNYGPVDVPNGHFFALSDNIRSTEDSRTWGPMPYSCLRGTVALACRKFKCSHE